jgi:hypothetical protein
MRGEVEPLDDATDAACWIVAFFVVRHFVAPLARNGEVPLFPVVGAAAIALVLIATFCRPRTVFGKGMFFLSLLPLTGLALTAAGLAWWPEGHPSLGGLLWGLTTSVALPCLVATVFFTVAARRADEGRAFVLAHTVTSLVVYVFATVLVPIP